MPGGRTLSNNKTQDKAKPLIVLDGANIACAYKDTRPPGDATGIVQAFENYDSQGHKVICFVKQYRIRNERNPKAVMNNIELFNEKIPKDSIATVPGKSDDDSFFIDYCMKNGAVLITNDGLRDHEERFEGDEKDAFLKWRKTNKCGFMFVAGSYLEEPGFNMPDAPNEIKHVEPEVKQNPVQKTKNTSKKKQTPKKKNSKNKVTKKDNNLPNKNELRKRIASIILEEMEDGILVGELGNRMPKWCNQKMNTSFKTVTQIKQHLGYGKSKRLVLVLEDLLGEKIRFDGELANITVYRVGIPEKKNTVKVNNSGEAINIILKIMGWELKAQPFWTSSEAYSMKYSEIGEHFKRETGDSIKSKFSKVGDLVNAIRTMKHPSLVRSFDCQYDEKSYVLTIREVFSPLNMFKRT
tara:strand:- start:1772 stop:3001 length:1230 start_codon:yes stop_codon:yes gene_type:complete